MLDTHAWLWWAADPSKIPPRTRRRIGAARDLVVSAISCWEIAMLVERGRLRLRVDTRSAISQLLTVPRLRCVHVTDAIATEAGLLGADFHGDPADRIVVATARELGGSLATGDARIRASSKVPTLW